MLVDTGPIVAFFDKDDRYHSLCLDILRKIRKPLITTWPVLTECFYLLNFSWIVQDHLWLFVQRGGIDVWNLAKEDVARVRDLMKQYRDLPMDLADATLVAAAEALNTSEVFTLDHRDFSTYRLEGRRRFILIPSEL